MPGRHPDDDVLADLAADVLPADQARSVEAHVLGCDRCAGLLEDAEQVRALLLADDPGPVPDDVWRRIESALAAEAGQGGDTSQADRVADRAADTAAFQAFVDAPGAPGRAVPLPAPPPTPVQGDADPGWADDADPLDDPGRWGAARAARASRSRDAGSRRDARDRAPRRRGPLLLAAAAAVAVVAVAGSVQLAGRSDSNSAAMSAGGAEGPSPAAGAGGGAAAASAPIVESGRKYSEKTLATQAESLLGLTGAVRAVTPASPVPSTSGGSSASTPVTGPVPGPAPAPGRATTRSESLVAPDAAADDITNPTRLAACLSALGVSPSRLVAVDLATYQGREAAILLLTTADGNGHEVWAVERTCAPGAEGALKYTRLED